MSRRKTSRKLTAAQTQELHVAAAVAREAVVQIHVEHAMDLIRAAAGRVSEMRMLDIYIRVMELPGPAEEVLANRVLAALGRTRKEAAASGMFQTAPEEEDSVDDEKSLLGTIRRRLRGRVHDTLRRNVELRTGVVNAILLDTHVAHARGFVTLLEGSQPIGDACRRYVELVPMSPALAGVLYFMVLDRIAAEEASAAWPAAKGIDVAAAARARQLPARVAQRTGQRARTSA
jgi:hypothetical protein